MMSDNSHTTPSVNEADVQQAHHFWSGFTKFTTYSVLGVVAVLVLLAIFLV